ncbi:MAG TPA: hypothetical protein VJA47_04195, partial [archaeon]|nr:hypothetical protein [archaeon]
MKSKILVILIGVFLAVGAASVFAIEINMVFGGSSTASLDRTKFFDKTLTIDKNNLHISISGKGGYVLNSILLFLCKDKDPVECDLSNPIEYEKFAETDFLIDQVSTNGKLNIFTLVNANSSWIGGWDTIENGVLKTTDIDKVELTLKHNVS